MANPFHVPYTLAEGETLTLADGECHVGPKTIMMREIDRAKLLPRQDAADPSPKCFPDYCAIDMAMPAEGYRNFHIVPAGTTLEIPVPDMEGCAMPNRVFFNWCGDCIIVDFDKVATSEEVTDGNGPEINPRLVYIGKQGEDNERVRTISVMNPSLVDAYLSLQYYC